MSLTQYEAPWTQQPQQAVRPAAWLYDYGVVSILHPPAGLIDLAVDEPFLVAGTAPTIEPTAVGLACKFDGASALFRRFTRSSSGYVGTQIVLFAPSRVDTEEVIVASSYSGGNGRQALFFLGQFGGDPFWAQVRSSNNSAGNAESGASGAAIGKWQAIAARQMGSASRDVWIDGSKRATNSTVVSGGVPTLDRLSFGGLIVGDASPAAGTTGLIAFALQTTGVIPDQLLGPALIELMNGNFASFFAPQCIGVPDSGILIPFLSDPTVTQITQTTARPRVTLTF